MIKMAEIRILHLVSSLSKSSGVMSVIMNYYRNINRNEVQFDFLYFQNIENTYKKEIEDLGGKVFLISKPSVSRSFKNELENFFKDYGCKYAALHNHQVALNFLFSSIAKKHGIDNIIVHSHTTMYSDKRINAIRNRILCIGLKKHATHYFACSKAAGEFLYGKKSVIEGKVSVINNAIDIEKFKFSNSIRKKIREELNVNDKFVIGHVGRFNEQKNHTFLIEIFYEIKKQNQNAMLILVGDGPLMTNVKEKVKKLKLESDVLFLGKRSDIPILLHSMDIFLLPSIFEGLPVAGVEAQASGLPIVMSTEITKEIGLLNYKFVDLKETPEYWAREILNIKQCGFRDKAYLEVKEKGFDIKQEAKKLEKIYMEMQVQ